LASDTEALRKHQLQVEASKRDELAGISVSINGLETQLLKENELNTFEQQIRTKRAAQYQEYNQAQQHLINLRNSIKMKETAILNLQQSVNQNNELINKIELLKGQVTDSQNIIGHLNAGIEILESAAQIFSPTGAQAYIMDSAIDSFNSAVTEYVEIIWPSASYELQAYKEKKDKTKVAKFSEMLMINGKKCSIGSLSGGQQRALSLAVDFAIRDVIDAQFGIDMNPIILDEPFDGLDSVGREIVIELLEKLAVKRNIWVVDHASEAKALFTDVIKVEKR